MIKVFNGAWRGIGESDQRLYLNIEFGFRDLIHHFKGAKLHVFMALCLHSDQAGLSFPSYTTLQKETGYSREAISRTLDELCETKIDGHHVLMRWRETNDNGSGVGSNRYRIFPTAAEIAGLNSEPEGQSENVTSHKSRLPDSHKIELVGSHKSRLEEEPVFKNEPIEENNNHAPPEPKPPAPATPTPVSSSFSYDCSEMFRFHDTNFGTLTQYSRDMLLDYVETYGGPDIVIDAMRVAVQANKKSLRYTEGVLKNWHADGRDDKKTKASSPTKSNNTAGSYVPVDVMAELERITLEQQRIGSH